MVLDDTEARTAVNRQKVTLTGDVRIDVLEVYCGECRRPYEDVALTTCESAESNEHLRGGPIGVRAKRGAIPVQARAGHDIVADTAAS